MSSPTERESGQVRFLYFSRGISDFGDMLLPVGLVVVAVSLGGAGSLSIILAARALPAAAAAFVGGAWCDQFGAKRIAIAADLLRAGTQAAVVAAFLSDALTTVTLAVLVLLYGVGAGLGAPAYRSLLPQVVSDVGLVRANSVLSSIRGTARVVGPLLASAILVLGSPYWIFLIDAITFVVAAALIAFLRLHRSTKPPAVRPTEFAFAVEGFTEVRRRPWIGAILVYFAAFQFFALGPLMVLGPVMFESRQQLDWWGVFLAAGGLGGVAGSVWLWRRGHVSLRLAMTLSLIDSAQLVFLALGVPMFLLLFAGLVAGVVSAAWEVSWVSTVQREVPKSHQGRVWAIDEMASLVLTPVAFLVVGLAQARIGDASVLLLGALGAIAVALAVLALTRFPPDEGARSD